MKEHLPKIGIFAAIIILQIGLAYGLVTYILPPSRVQSKDSSQSSAVNPQDLQGKNDTGGSGDGQEGQQAEGETGEDDLAAKAEGDSLREAEFYNELSDYLEEEIPAKDLKNAMVFTLDDMIINPAQTRGTRYIVMSLDLLIKGKDLDKKWEAKLPAVRDAINTLISRKTVLWLSDIDNRPYLREEIKLLLESVLGDAKVLRVYFTKYLFQ